MLHLFVLTLVVATTVTYSSEKDARPKSPETILNNVRNRSDIKALYAALALEGKGDDQKQAVQSALAEFKERIKQEDGSLYHEALREIHEELIALAAKRHKSDLKEREDYWSELRIQEDQTGEEPDSACAEVSYAFSKQIESSKAIEQMLKKRWSFETPEFLKSYERTKERREKEYGRLSGYFAGVVAGPGFHNNYNKRQKGSH